MGMYDKVIVDAGVELPEFEHEKSQEDIIWQTKSLYNLLDTFRISEDGRLLRFEQVKEEKTDEEKLEEAQEYGFESWEEYKEALYDRVNDEENPYEDDMPLFPQEEKVVEEKWVDHNQHGSFRFSVGGDIRLEYEARFTDGELDEIILLKKKYYEQD